MVMNLRHFSLQTSNKVCSAAILQSLFSVTDEQDPELE